MTKSRAALLNAVGFCWDTHEATWLERFRELKQYKDDHGHCNVPTNYTANAKLGTWAHHQRRQYRKWKNDLPTHITTERVDLLESIGFVWSPRQPDGGVNDEDGDEGGGSGGDDGSGDPADDDQDIDSESASDTTGQKQEDIIEPTPVYFSSNTVMERRLREARVAKRRKTTSI
jgi:hypothetical protein